MKFRSKIDALIIGPLMAIILYFLISSILEDRHVSTVIVGLIMLFFVHMLVTTTYEVKGGLLKIRSSIVRKMDVKISDIISLQETNDTKSGPANSMDRIRIVSAKRTILVSPKRKLEFIDALLKINPEIRLLPKQN